jgi:hypothetical protein
MLAEPYGDEYRSKAHTLMQLLNQYYLCSNQSFLLKALHQVCLLACPSKPLSTTYGPQAGGTRSPGPGGDGDGG